eukprot:gnl/Spiro4/2455_TR1178_c0_g1_i1.p1 gnl/Spiro4/2455_TR1178_c0_g1~~gnl/Spiro4/2455_TR1178_c0_g1_i1.p1  ORF type:complete len:580 (+),score=113.99 gnl/Spiro4/2455_TR1178_c0_g1_i1:31-1770(+)
MALRLLLVVVGLCLVATVFARSVHSDSSNVGVKKPNCIIKKQPPKRFWMAGGSEKTNCHAEVLKLGLCPMLHYSYSLDSVLEEDLEHFRSRVDGSTFVRPRDRKHLNPEERFANVLENPSAIHLDSFEDVDEEETAKAAKYYDFFLSHYEDSLQKAPVTTTPSHQGITMDACCCVWQSAKAPKSWGVGWLIEQSNPLFLPTGCKFEFPQYTVSGPTKIPMIGCRMYPTKFNVEGLPSSGINVNPLTGEIEVMKHLALGSHNVRIVPENAAGKGTVVQVRIEMVEIKDKVLLPKLSLPENEEDLSDVDADLDLEDECLEGGIMYVDEYSVLADSEIGGDSQSVLLDSLNEAANTRRNCFAPEWKDMCREGTDDDFPHFLVNECSMKRVLGADKETDEIIKIVVPQDNPGKLFGIDKTECTYGEPMKVIYGTEPTPKALSGNCDPFTYFKLKTGELPEGLSVDPTTGSIVGSLTTRPDLKSKKELIPAVNALEDGERPPFLGARVYSVTVEASFPIMTGRYTKDLALEIRQYVLPDEVTNEVLLGCKGDETDIQDMFGCSREDSRTCVKLSGDKPNLESFV